MKFSHKTYAYFRDEANCEFFIGFPEKYEIAHGVTGFTGNFILEDIKPHEYFEAYTEMKNEEAEEWLKSQDIY